MGKFKDTIISLGYLGIILVVGLGLILILGGLSIGIQWLWKQIPFGIAGFILGSVVIAITFFMAKQIFFEREFRVSWDFLNELGFLEIIGYLFGFIIIFASILWFFLPAAILRILPSFGGVLMFSIFFTFLLYGVGGCFATSIISFRIYVLGALFYGACAIFGLWIINAPIWSYTESIPTDYYFLGKVVFAFIFFLQILYLSFFHFFPAIKQYQKEKAEEKVKETENQPK